VSPSSGKIDEGSEIGEMDDILHDLKTGDCRCGVFKAPSEALGAGTLLQQTESRSGFDIILKETSRIQDWLDSLWNRKKNCRSH